MKRKAVDVDVAPAAKRRRFDDNAASLLIELPPTLGNIVVSYLHELWPQDEPWLTTACSSRMIAWQLVLLHSDQSQRLFRHCVLLCIHRHVQADNTQIDKLLDAIFPFDSLVPSYVRALRSIRDDLKPGPLPTTAVAWTMLSTASVKALNVDSQFCQALRQPHLKGPPAPQTDKRKGPPKLNICLPFGRAIVSVDGQDWDVTTRMMVVLDRVGNRKGPHMVNTFGGNFYDHIAALVQARLLRVHPVTEAKDVLSPLQSLWIGEAKAPARLVPVTHIRNPLRIGDVFNVQHCVACLTHSYSGSQTRSDVAKFVAKRHPHCMPFCDIDGMIGEWFCQLKQCSVCSFCCTDHLIATGEVREDEHGRLHRM